MLHFDCITDCALYSTLSFGDTDSLKLIIQTDEYHKIWPGFTLFVLFMLPSIDLFLFQKYLI